MKTMIMTMMIMTMMMMIMSVLLVLASGVHAEGSGAWEPSCHIGGDWSCVYERSRFFENGSATQEVMVNSRKTLSYTQGDVTFTGSYQWFQPLINETVYETNVCAFEIWSSMDEPVAKCYDLEDATVFRVHFLDECTRYVAVFGEAYGVIPVEGSNAWIQTPSIGVKECVKVQDATASSPEEDTELEKEELEAVVDPDTSILLNWQPTCDVGGSYSMCPGNNEVMRYSQVEGVSTVNSFSGATVMYSQPDVTFTISYSWYWNDVLIEEEALCAFEIWSNMTSPRALCFDSIDNTEYQLYFVCDTDCGNCEMQMTFREAFGNVEVLEDFPWDWRQGPIAGTSGCMEDTESNDDDDSDALALTTGGWQSTCDIGGDWTCTMRKRQANMLEKEILGTVKQTIVFSPDDVTFSILYEGTWDSPYGEELIQETMLCAFKQWSDTLNPQAICADAIDSTLFTLQFECDNDCNCVLKQEYGEASGHFEVPGIGWNWKQGAVAGVLECGRE